MESGGLAPGVFLRTEFGGGVPASDLRLSVEEPTVGPRPMEPDLVEVGVPAPRASSEAARPNRSGEFCSRSVAGEAKPRAMEAKLNYSPISTASARRRCAEPRPKGVPASGERVALSPSECSEEVEGSLPSCRPSLLKSFSDEAELLESSLQERLPEEEEVEVARRWCRPQRRFASELGDGLLGRRSAAERRPRSHSSGEETLKPDS